MLRRGLTSASCAGALLACHIVLLTLFLNPAARLAPEVARHGDAAAVKKVIVVPGRLVNVVL